MPDLQMTVAVTRPFPLLFEVPDAPSGNATWDGLPQTTVAATPDERLRDVLRRAADLLDVRLTADALEAHRGWAQESASTVPAEHAADHLVYVGFWRPDDDDLIDAGDGVPPMRRRLTRLDTTVLIVRDDAGRAVWRRPGLDATVGELVDAQAAGLLEGDPLRPYLIPSTPQGDPAMVGEWVRFIESLQVLWQVAEALATVGGTWGFVELLKAARKRRQPAALKAIERHSSDWATREAGPADLFRFLIAKPRGSVETAALLGCSRDEAEAILWAFGCVFDEDDQRWHYRGDPVATLLGDDIDMSFAFLFESADGRERLERFATSRLAHMLETGEPPSLDEGLVEIREREAELFDAMEAKARRRRWRWRIRRRDS